MKTGIILLAAGNSSRLGKPKQLLPFKGKTLLEHTFTAAARATLSPVLIVLGAFADEILDAHKHLDAQFYINSDWAHGMSASISSGIRQMLKTNPEVDQVILSVADQPFISAQIFSKLIEKQRATQKNIISSRYSDTSGSPTLFNKKYFEALSKLDGKMGAKNIIKQFAADTETISFELGYVDIDTEKDYKNLIQE
ncbi:nucleotidyltransferase family protein [Pedobacter sp. AW1-32]|uniref:nucleotidyltransferase family protein n=1 Tax=Pedobacter sp. AW1-32 TaxID=3383026 RepID=UPI003FEE0049